MENELPVESQTPAKQNAQQALTQLRAKYGPGVRQIQYNDLFIDLRKDLKFDESAPLFVIPGATKKDDTTINASQKGVSYNAVTDLYLFRTCTPEQVRAGYMTDEHLQKWLKSSHYNNTEVQRAYEHMAHQLGLTEVPPLIYVKSAHFGSTGQTRTGKYFIKIGPGNSNEEILDTLAHELGHVVNDDANPQEVAANINSNSFANNIAQEAAADQVAIQLCKGRGLAKDGQYYADHIQKIRRESLQQYEHLSNHPPCRNALMC